MRRSRGGGGGGIEGEEEVEEEARNIGSLVTGLPA